MEFKRNFFSVFDHKPDALNTEYVSNFMRIRNGGDGSVDYGHTGEFGRNEHGTFDVDVRIDESWHQEMTGRGRELANGRYFLVGDFNFAREYSAGGDVNDLSGYDHD